MKTLHTCKSVLFALGFCCLPLMAQAATEDDYLTALEQAKTAQAAAKKVDNQWFYKKDLIAQAEEAAGKSDYDTATKLAQKAKFQGDMAVKQAEEQKNAGPYPAR
ncbi:MAG: hypothetical protein AB1717_03465 [Pseudomonadota bacterium]